MYKGNLGFVKFSNHTKWLGDNATRYHDLNTLPHVLPYIFSEICLVTRGNPLGHNSLMQWLGHNAMHYRDLNALSHTLPYIFFEICLVFGNL